MGNTDVAGLVVLSFGDEFGSEMRDHLVAAAQRALFRLEVGSVDRLVTAPNNLVLTAGRGDAVAVSAGRLGLGRLTRDGVEPLAPGVQLSWDERSVLFRTDEVGLRHLYVRQGSGWAAASTSSLVLGALGETAVDETSLGALALLGFLIEHRTVLREVTRVPAAHEVCLVGGQVQVQARTYSSKSEEVQDGAEVVRNAVAACLEEYPHLGLELSGGLDSRILLAAIPQEERKGRTAVTLGGRDDPDVLVARRIAAMQGLDHQVVPPMTASTLKDASLLAQVLRSARKREHASDALAAYALDVAEEQISPSPRLTGVNGEFVRGFYYTGGREAGGISRRRVERLARWRLFVNHRADPRLFHADWLREREEEIVGIIHDRLIELGPSWHRATDEYYLAERIPNWAGPGYSQASTERTVLAPMLTSGFLAWARQVPVSDRAGSRAMGSMLEHLDPTLARLPMAGGGAPSALASRSAGSAVAKMTRTARKAMRKVRQRLHREARPPSGVSLLVMPLALELRQERHLGALSRFDFLDEQAIERLAAGVWTPDQPTVSLLINLIGIEASGGSIGPLQRGES